MRKSLPKGRLFLSQKTDFSPNPVSLLSCQKRNGVRTPQREKRFCGAAKICYIVRSDCTLIERSSAPTTRVRSCRCMFKSSAPTDFLARPTSSAGERSYTLHFRQRTQKAHFEDTRHQNTPLHERTRVIRGMYLSTRCAGFGAYHAIRFAPSGFLFGELEPHFSFHARKEKRGLEIRFFHAKKEQRL